MGAGLSQGGDVTDGPGHQVVAVTCADIGLRALGV